MWLGLLAVASAVCGDGIVDADEACDDFNLAAGDGCSETCAEETFWECTSPPTPFLETVRWSGTTNCASSPQTDLQGRGVALSVPDWPVFAMSPTGLDCVSAWSSGDSGRWFYSTRWQAGPASAGLVGGLGSPRLSLAACRAESQSATAVIRPEGQSTVYFGMLDNPCYDNRGTVQLEVAAISECVFVGDPDEDGRLNDVDVCPTVYLDLEAPYAANFACVSEASTWDDATVGARALVHRDTVVSGSLIGPHAEVHRDATLDASVVMMRRSSVGQASAIGADAVLGPFTEVGAGVRAPTGGPVDGLVLAAFAAVGEGAVLGTNVMLGGRASLGDGVQVGSGTVFGRLARVDEGAMLGDGVVVGPVAWIGADAMLGAQVRVRRGAEIGAGAQLAAGVVVGRDVVVGEGAVIGEGTVLRTGVVIPPGAYVPSGLILSP